MGLLTLILEKEVKMLDILNFPPTFEYEHVLGLESPLTLILKKEVKMLDILNFPPTFEYEHVLKLELNILP